MSTRDKEWIKYAALVVVILIAGYFGIRYPLPEMPEYIPPEDIEDMELYAVGPTRFRKIYVDHEATIAGVLTASGGVVGTVTGNVAGDVVGNLTGNVVGNMTGDLTNSTFLVIVPQTTISVTNAGILTPTGTYQPIESAAEVTPTIAITNAAGSRYTSGTLLVVINTSNTTINFADSGNVKTSGATALEQYDSLILQFDDTYWIEWAQANN